MELRIYRDLEPAERRLGDTPLIAVTRMNLYNQAHPNRATEHGDSEMLVLFKRFCLPAMLRQRLKPDAWYLLFDEDVRPAVAVLLKDLEQYPWIKPQIVPRSFGMNGYGRYVNRQIAKDFPVRAGLIACRVDSDDALNRSFLLGLEVAVERHLATTPKPERITFFNFTYGLINDRGETFRPFLNECSQTLCSYTPFGDGNPTTSCDVPHKNAGQYGPVIEITTEQPMWLYSLHDTNISTFNPRRYLITAPAADVETVFGINFAVLSEATATHAH